VSADSAKNVNAPTFGVTNLDLTDEETAALVRELNAITDGDRYQFSARIRTLKAIRDKLQPRPGREPLPPPKVYAPPRAPAARRRRWRNPNPARR